MKHLFLAAAVVGGMVGLAAPAQADPISLNVCMVLDDYPSISGVMGIVRALTEDGYSQYQAGRIIGTAVKNVCPEHLSLVERFASALA